MEYHFMLLLLLAVSGVYFVSTTPTEHRLQQILQRGRFRWRPPQNRLLLPFPRHHRRIIQYMNNTRDACNTVFGQNFRMPSRPFREWINFPQHESCIMRRTVQVSWQQSWQNCQRARGGKLLQLFDEDDAETFAADIHDIQTPFELTPDVATWIGIGEFCPRNGGKISLRYVSGGELKPDSYIYKQLRLDDEKVRAVDSPACVSVNVDMGTNKTTFQLQPCETKLSSFCERPIPDFFQNGTTDTVVDDDELADAAEAEESTKSDTATEAPCGEDEDPFWCKKDDKCFKLFTGTQLSVHKNFDQMWSGCFDLDGDLASIHSDADITFLDDMNQIQPYFGNAGNPTEFWIGLHRRNADRIYEWTDGTPINFMGKLESSRQPIYERSASCNVLYLPRKNNQRFRLSSRFSHSDPFVAGWKTRRCDEARPAICQKWVKGKEQKPTTSSRSHATCPADWLDNDGACYLFVSNETISYSDAEATCKDAHPKGGHSSLVSIKNIYEQAFLLAHSKNFTGDFWIGAKLAMGRLTWPDDAKSMISRHRQALVSAAVFNNACGYFSIGGVNKTSRRGDWGFYAMNDPKGNDTCDNVKLGYVCESFKSKPDGTEPPTDKDNCVSYDGDCYYFTNETMARNIDGTLKQPMKHLSWHQAEEYCKSISSGKKSQHLVSVNDKFQWSFLRSAAMDLGVKRFWIGLRFRQHDTAKDHSLFQWSDGSALSVAPWGFDQPKEADGFDCVSVRLTNTAAVWETQRCDWDTVLPFVCKATDKETKMASAPEGTCGRNWHTGKTGCYKVSDRVTQGVLAFSECMRQGATPASFKTERDYEMVKDLLKALTEPIPHTVLFGLTQTDEGGYSYADHTPLTFTHWSEDDDVDERQRHPGFSVANSFHAHAFKRRCVVIETTEYTWKRVRCIHPQRVLCSKPFDTISTRSKPATTNTPAVSTTDSTTATIKPAEPIDNAKKTDEKSTNAKNKAVGGKGEASSQSGSSPFGVLIAIVLCATVLVLLAVLGVFVYRRGGFKRMWTNRQPGILQFDALRNDDDEF